MEYGNKNNAIKVGINSNKTNRLFVIEKEESITVIMVINRINNQGLRMSLVHDFIF